MIKFYFKPKIKMRPMLKAKRLVFKGQKNAAGFYCICAFLIVVIILILGEVRLRPIIKNAGGNALKNELTLLLNQSVEKSVLNKNVKYEDFVSLVYDNDGNMSSVVTNTVFVNKFKAQLSNDVAKTVEECGDFNIIVPWGTLFGSEIFSDRGLELTVESSTYGFVVTDVYSSFESVGINQTLHRVYVKAKLYATAYIGDYRIDETITGNIPVAETVIIGEVPNAFYGKKTSALEN
jgi:sporulation protein YunB